MSEDTDMTWLEKRPNYTKIRKSDYPTVGMRIWSNALAWRIDSWKSCLQFCVPKGFSVNTLLGEFDISETFPGLETPFGVITKVGNRRVDYLINIVTESGIEIELTRDHPVLTKRGWVDAKDLIIGDEVVVENGKFKIPHCDEGMPSLWERVPDKIKSEQTREKILLTELLRGSSEEKNIRKDLRMVWQNIRSAGRTVQKPKILHTQMCSLLQGKCDKEGTENTLEKIRMQELWKSLLEKDKTDRCSILLKKLQQSISYEDKQPYEETRSQRENEGDTAEKVLGESRMDGTVAGEESEKTEYLGDVLKGFDTGSKSSIQICREQEFLDRTVEVGEEEEPRFCASQLQGKQKGYRNDGCLLAHISGSYGENRGLQGCRDRLFDNMGQRIASLVKRGRERGREEEVDTKDTGFHFERIVRLRRTYKPNTRVFDMTVNPLSMFSLEGVIVHNCTYCFAQSQLYGSLRRMGLRHNPLIGRTMDYPKMERRFQRIFDDGEIDVHDFVDWAILLKMAPEVGTIGEPLGWWDKDFGVTMSFLKLLGQYEMPLYITTKGDLLIEDENYYDAVVDLKKNGLAVDLSLISMDDKALRKYEPFAQPASKRLELIERLASDGVNVIVSVRPIIAGLTDVNYEDFIRELCERGASSIHLRTLVICGHLVSNPFWKKHAKEHNMVFKEFNYRYRLDYFMDLYRRAVEVAKDYGVVIAGSHSLFLKLQGYYNKGDLDKSLAAHLYPWNIVTFFKHVRERLDEPQLLRFDEVVAPYISIEHPWLDQDVRIDTYSQTLIWATSSMRKPRYSYLVPHREVIARSIWDGWGHLFPIRASYASTIKQIFTVVGDDGNFVLDERGHRIYAYIPEELKQSSMISTHYASDTVTLSELKEFGLEV
ncbi:MAG: hypothetical protein ACTSUO_06060 [Candidatus Thorarchaeota archaeon]